jgi:hypothetical protein
MFSIFKIIFNIYLKIHCQIIKITHCQVITTLIYIYITIRFCTHTDRAPEGECVKRMEEPGGKVSGLKSCLNVLTASTSASVKMPMAFQWAMQFSETLSEYCSPVRGSIMVTRTNFSNGPAYIN